MKRVLFIILLIIILAIGGLLFSPLSPLPGGALTGEIVEEPVNDWSFAEDERICHFEMNPPDPYSITVTCIVHEGQLYVGCRSCPSKGWHDYINTDPNARYRVLGKVYNVTAVRVTDPEEVNRVWAARIAKDGSEPEPAPEDYWVFHLTSR